MAASSSVLVLSLAMIVLCLLPTASCQYVRIAATNTSVFKGDTKEFLCDCPARHTSNDTLEWLHNGTVVRTSPLCRPSVLRLVSMDYQDAGEYTCRRNLGDGRVKERSVFVLNVFDPSTIIVPPRQYALLHSNTRLNCTASTIYDLRTVFFRWFANGSYLGTQLEFTNASMRHEGRYVCEVWLSQYDVYRNKSVDFSVIVPPRITSSPDSPQLITGTVPLSLSVEFQSHFKENTTISWYKDDSPIPVNRIQTEYTNVVNGITNLSIAAVVRNDEGVYRVVIENSNDIIPANQSRAEASFRIEVNVPPALPANVHFEITTATSARITWELTNQAAEDAADMLKVTLRYSNQSIAQQKTLPGVTTETTVDVLPGMEYSVSVTVFNHDGNRTTDSLQLHTPPAVPSVTSLEVIRQNVTTFNIVVTLSYTGGGEITHFRVSFRRNGTTASSYEVDVPATRSPSSSLVWNGVITINELTGRRPVEFQIGVANARNMMTPLIGIAEQAVPPGPPLPPSLLSFSTTSLTIEVQLSSEGTPPIEEVIVRITHPYNMDYNFNGSFSLGETLQFVLDELNPGTEYNIVVLAVNSVGVGEESEGVMFSTESEPTPSSPIILVVTVIVVVALVLVLLTTILVIFICCWKRNQKNKFYIDPRELPTADERKLDPNHEMVNRRLNNKPSLNSIPLTPRGPTSTDKLWFETVSTSTGSNHESDVSEGNCPRYTYSVSPTPGSLHSLPARTASHHTTRESMCSPAPVPNSTNV